MPTPKSNYVKSAATLIVLTIVSASIVFLGRDIIQKKTVGPDFLCFWTAAQNLVSGHSPYDLDEQIRIQSSLGWDKEAQGLGIYDCIPYFYPPWLAFLFVPLLPLGFTAAKLVWFFTNI